MTELADIGLRVNSSNAETKDLILGADLRREIYLIFKETINNLVKHSACEKATIEFRLEGDEFVCVVLDDGRGFDVGNTNGNGSLAAATV
jgi:signal transduction histidine kinase